MRFVINISNHNESGKNAISDLVQWVYSGLKNCGFSVSISSDVDLGAVNLFFENFRPGFSELLSGVRFGIIATEMPDGGGFNNNRDSVWTRRWLGFKEVSQYCEFIWTLTEQTLESYTKFAPTYHLRLGFVDEMALQPSEQREYDFCFLGSRTSHRQKLIAELSKHANVLWPSGHVAAREYLRLICTAKIGLCLRLGEDWEYPSYSRIGRLLHAGVYIVGEFTPYDGYFSGYYSEPRQGDDFIEFALQNLKKDWQKAGIINRDRYKKQIPMETEIRQLVEDTFLGLRSFSEQWRQFHCERYFEWYPERFLLEKSNELDFLVDFINSLKKVSIYGIGSIAELVIPRLTCRIEKLYDSDRSRCGESGGFNILHSSEVVDGVPIVVLVWARKDEIYPSIEGISEIYFIDDIMKDFLS